MQQRQCVSPTKCGAWSGPVMEYSRERPQYVPVIHVRSFHWMWRLDRRTSGLAQGAKVSL
jgi:hypothetical protein